MKCLTWTHQSNKDGLLKMHTNFGLVLSHLHHCQALGPQNEAPSIMAQFASEGKIYFSMQSMFPSIAWAWDNPALVCFEIITSKVPLKHRSLVLY